MAASQNTVACPYCGHPETHAEWVDVGIGSIQCGPYHCEQCEATEIGPHDTAGELTEEERRTGWYRPGKLPPEVSTIGGKLVDHHTALAMYRKGLVSQVPFHI
jgi:hypothetical protein